MTISTCEPIICHNVAIVNSTSSEQNIQLATSFKVHIVVPRFVGLTHSGVEFIDVSNKLST